MKLMKKFKSGLIGLGLVIPIASVGGVVASCGKKETPPAKTTFGDFTKAAKAETAVNIVAQTKVWKSLPKKDLIKATPVVVGETVVVSITSTPNSQTAVFVATYVKDTAYNISSWKCPDGPKDTVLWTAFKTSIENSDVTTIFANLKKADLNNVNIDLVSISDASLILDPSKSAITDNSKDTVTLVLGFGRGNNLPFDIEPKITLTIKWTGVAYDVENWASDYTFTNFTTDAKLWTNTQDWKSGIIKQLADPSWTDKTATVGPITATTANNTLSVSITLTADKTVKTLILPFRNENSKVWIYGEQMGDKDSPGGWRITTAPGEFLTTAKNFINRGDNNKDNTASQDLIGQIKNAAKAKPKACANLNTFFTNNSDITKLKFIIDASSFKDVAATGTVKEIVTFNMVFYLISDTPHKTPLTSGGIFQITNSGGKILLVTDCGVNADINPLPKLNLLFK